MVYYICNRCDAVVLTEVDVRSYECGHCKKGIYSKKEVPSGYDDYTSKDFHNFKGIVHTTVSC